MRAVIQFMRCNGGLQDQRINWRIALCLIAFATLSACASPVTNVRPKFSTDGTSDGDTRSHYARGKSHLENAKFGLAVKEFGMALSRKPKSVEILNGLAVGYDRLGRFDLATRYYHRALRLDPHSVQTNNNIGYSYYLQGEFELATNILAKIRGSLGAGPVVARNFHLARLAVTKARRDQCRAAAESASNERVAPRPDGRRPRQTLRIVRVNSLVQRLVAETDPPSRSAAIATRATTVLTRPTPRALNQRSPARPWRAVPRDGACSAFNESKRAIHDAAVIHDDAAGSMAEPDANGAGSIPAKSNAERNPGRGIEVRFNAMPELFELEPGLIDPIGSKNQNEPI